MIFNIEPLYEKEEEETYAIRGFWAKGHQRIKDFVKFAESEFNVEYSRPIEPHNVFHGWVKPVTDKETVGDVGYYLDFSQKPDKDSQKATYFFYE